MSIKDVKESVDLLLKYPQAVTPYIHGIPGVGKSAIISQIAKSRNIGFIDLRLSQLESSDLRGIPTPDHSTSSSRWLPPETIPFEAFEDLPVPGCPGRRFKDGGILFLDEFNRARFDVIQAAFQLVLDRRIGLHKILDNWFLVCSGNLGEEDGTDVTEIYDSALNNRFAHFYVSESGMLDAWIEWATGPGEIHKDIVGFLQYKPSALYIKPSEGAEAYATPRTWEMMSNVLKQNKEVEEDKIVKILGSSILGTTTISFLDYLKQKKVIKPIDVVKDYSNKKQLIESLDRSRKYSISNELASFLCKDVREITEQELVNIHNFAIDQLHEDHLIAFFKDLTSSYIKYEGKKQEFLDVYLDSFPEMNDTIANIFYGAKS